MRSLLLAVVSSAALWTSLSTAESPDPVRVRELTVPSELRAPEQSVRSSLDAEAKRVTRRHPKLDRRADLSVVIVRRARSEGAIEVVVSAAVRDARSGSVLGMVEGRASAASASTSELAIVRQAASGAFSLLPAVLTEKKK